MAGETNIITISSQDLPALRGRLEKMGAEAPRIITEMFDDYGRQLVGALKEEVPVKTGMLRDTIKHEITGANTNEVELHIVMGNNQRPEVVIKTLMFGSLPHVIKPKRPGGVLVFEIKGQTVFTKYVNHPGTARDPFVLRALHKTDSLRRSMIGKIGALIVEEIER